MKPGILGLVILILAGCGGKEPQAQIKEGFQNAKSVKAASLLKQYQAAQNVYRMQSERCYGAMNDLAGQQLINEELANAWDRQTKPRAINGYLFADIEQGEDGRPIQRQDRAGLCAYPRRGNGQVILMLLDINDPEEWAFYTADSATIGAVRRWPSPAELDSKFTRKRQDTPQEELPEAQKPSNRVR